MESNETNAFNIAVTGHRFIPDDANIYQAIRQVLQDILSNHDETPVMLLSALAEGSDQLVVKIAL